MNPFRRDVERPCVSVSSSMAMVPPVLIFLTPIRTPHGVAWARNHHSDGLATAYSRPNGLYRDGNVLFIAGTKSFGDIVDDLRIPF